MWRGGGGGQRERGGPSNNPTPPILLLIYSIKHPHTRLFIYYLDKALVLVLELGGEQVLIHGTITTLLLTLTKRSSSYLNSEASKSASRWAELCVACAGGSHRPAAAGGAGRSFRGCAGRRGTRAAGREAVAAWRGFSI